MALTPKVFYAQVMHKRIFPKENAFKYRLYYLVLPLKDLNNIKQLNLNKFGLISFYEKDHGKKDGSDLLAWAREILSTDAIDTSNMQVLLVTLPRVIGYLFNPVSFYLCVDNTNQLRAVIYEVNNTFGETHSYVCSKNDQTAITIDDTLETDKVFHVSPFLRREGKYQFRIDYRIDKLGIWIDYFDAAGNKELITSLTGHLSEMTKRDLIKAFWKYPLVTIKAIFMIHYQALKLFFKGVQYIAKPIQKDIRVTHNNKGVKN